MIALRLTILAALCWLLPVATGAAEPKITTVLAKLQNPCGVAVQPETGIVFVSESSAGQIIRVVEGKPEPVVTGFKTDVYGKGPMYNIGPLGLVFLARDTLVVGGGDLPDGEDRVRVFTVPTTGQPPISVDAATASFALPAEGQVPAEGNFFGLAANAEAVFVTSNGDDAQGWVAKAPRKGNTLVGLTRFLATKPAVQLDAPTAITVSPRGELVVGQMGELDVEKDGVVTFYSSRDGRKLLNLPTGLHDLTALTYSPKGQLLATDFAWKKPEDGGLFQLVAVLKEGKQSLEARKRLPLERPTAMAFAPDGALYVTVLGSGAGDQPTGSLLLVEME